MSGVKVVGGLDLDYMGVSKQSAVLIFNVMKKKAILVPSLNKK